MNSKELKEIENKVYKEPDNMENIRKVQKNLIISSTIYLSITSIVFIALLFIYEKVNLLSIIPLPVFVILLLITIVYLVVSLLFSTVLKNNLKPVYFMLYYKIYDMLAYVLLLITVLSFIVTFFITPTNVVGNSMNSTLKNGDKVLIWHLGYTPKDDDIVVLHVSKKYGTDDSMFIKRVVATSGDKVTYVEGSMYVNSVKVETMSSYEFQKCMSLHGSESGTSQEYTIPKGYSVVLGDHRTNSEDSRVLGLIDNDDILGHAVFSLMPFKKISGKKLLYD